MLLTGGADSKVMLWQGDPTKLRLGTVTAPQSTFDHGGIVRVLRWCPFDSGEKRRFASASEKLGSKPPAIAVWQVSQKAQAERLLQLENLPTKSNDLQWGGGAKTKLFSAHDNGYVGVWSAEGEGSLLKTIKLHAGPVSCLVLTNDGTVLVTASHDRTVAAVDVSKPSTDTLATYKANRPINAVVASADFVAASKGVVVVGGGRDPRDVTTSKELAEDENEATVLDAVGGEPVASGKGHFGPIHALLALPTLGQYGAFASVSEDGCVKVHGIDGKLLHSDTLQG
jgi:WD40 repeat protein